MSAPVDTRTMDDMRREIRALRDAAGIAASAGAPCHYVLSFVAREDPALANGAPVLRCVVTVPHLDTPEKEAADPIALLVGQALGSVAQAILEAVGCMARPKSIKVTNVAAVGRGAS